MLLIYTKPQRWIQFYLSSPQLNQLRHVLHIHINFFKPPNQATFHSCPPRSCKKCICRVSLETSIMCALFLNTDPPRQIRPSCAWMKEEAFTRYSAWCHHPSTSSLFSTSATARA
ncbi:hypothetical protein HDV62DRAFT_152500 [Trichoderma sp. SZMC 28011]